MPNYAQQYYRPSMFGGFTFFPTVIKWLMITNAVIFGLVTFFGQLTFHGVELWLISNKYLGLMPLGNGFYPWQLITYQFMHADIFHLFFNMFFGLWMFGMEIEHLWGPRKFLFFYLGCGIVAGLTQLFLGPLFGQEALVIGASGAVFGVMTAFAMMFPERYVFLYFMIPLKVKYLVAVLVLMGVVFIGPGVARFAHLGGLLAGYAYVSYDMRRIPFQGVVDRIKWWMNSRSVKRYEEGEDEVAEAKVYDIRDGKDVEQREAQKKIDEILDKITQGGYQSLTEEEKKILFDASKKLN